jgi:outer membrane protein OmpA-like peptidoglycan-associated protein
MKKMKKIFLILMMSALIAVQSHAQSEDRKWTVGVFGGAAQYNGDLGNGFYKFDQAFYAFGGMSLARYITPHLDGVLHGSYGDIGHLSDVGHFNDRMLQFNIHARWSFFKYDNSVVRPFVLAGFGILNNKDKSTDESFMNTTRPLVGGGVAFRLSPVIALRIQENLIFSDYDADDGIIDDVKDKYLLHQIGLEFNLGKPKDTDGDGVKDRDDMCPGTPQGVTVDLNGCPVDTDLDGIPDYQDDCPDVAGLAQFNGCPDRDGDGIQDKDDACPDTPGLEQFAGCPDRDGDGVIDADDECPDTPGLHEFNGCPDTDMDGIPDKDDVCPNEAGIAELNGCPKILQVHLEKLEKAEFGIQFEFAKATLAESSFETLDEVATILAEHPRYNLLIEGHTDSKGNDDFNMKLSRDRAASVEKYIESKGIDEMRISSIGYGETKPIADNETEEGRAKNRRVELVIEVD